MPKILPSHQGRGGVGLGRRRLHCTHAIQQTGVWVCEHKAFTLRRELLPMKGGCGTHGWVWMGPIKESEVPFPDGKVGGKEELRLHAKQHVGICALRHNAIVLREELLPLKGGCNTHNRV